MLCPFLDALQYRGQGRLICGSSSCSRIAPRLSAQCNTSHHLFFEGQAQAVHACHISGIRGYHQRGPLECRPVTTTKRRHCSKSLLAARRPIKH